MARPRIQDMLVAIADLKTAIEQGFGGVDGRLGGVDGRLGGIDVRLDGIDVRLDGIDVRLDGIDGRLGGIDVRLDKHDAHFVRLDQGLLALGLRVERLDERLTGRIDELGLEMAGGFDRVDARLGTLEDEYQAMKQGLRRLEQERRG